MSLLVSEEIYQAICNELCSAKQSVQILTAYGKVKAISALLCKVSTDVREKRILFRFRLDDLISGSTDFDVINFCRNQGWDVFIRFDLHAKTYVVDKKRGIVGSANATSSGLSLSQSSNSEMAALVDIEAKDLMKINSFFNDAILVDDDIWFILSEEYNEAKGQASSGKLFRWSKKITSLFTPRVEALFSYELPEAAHFESGDFVHFLDLRYTNESDFKEAFRWSRSYLWLLNELKEHNGCMYFGELSASLHCIMVEDPKPFRKDVKILLSNLLSLVSELEMDEVIVDRPNYSQRIRLKNESD